MGGEREIEIGKPTKSKSLEGVTFGTLRAHEKEGHIHFHDDANKRKAAIPSAVWFSLYERFNKEASNRVQYADPLNRTLLTVKHKIRKGKKKMILDIKAKIKPLEVTTDFAALQKFTLG
jgi:hypothetical protein